MTALALQLDVTNQGSIAAAAERLRSEFGFTSTSRQASRMREARQFARGGCTVEPHRPTALLIGEGVRDVLPHRLGYWNDGAQKSAGDGNGCG